MAWDVKPRKGSSRLAKYSPTNTFLHGLVSGLGESARRMSEPKGSQRISNAFKEDNSYLLVLPIYSKIPTGSWFLKNLSYTCNSGITG